jgi:hypothetical protein
MRPAWQRNLTGCLIAAALLALSVELPASAAFQMGWEKDADRTMRALWWGDDMVLTPSAGQMDGPESNAVSLFKPFVVYPIEGGARVLAIGDFNHDGWQDVIVAGNDLTEPRLFVFHQTDNGTLEAPDLIELPSPPQALTVGDFNHDGWDDAATAGQYDGLVYFILQQEFGEMVVQPPISAGNGSKKMIAADFNADGRDDLAVANLASDFISLFYQQTDGSMGVEARYSSEIYGYDDLDAGDMNQDGLTDLVKLTGLGPDEVMKVYYQGSDGRLLDAVDKSLIPAPENPYKYANGAAVGDISGDGYPDVALTYGGNRPGSKILVYDFKHGSTAQTDSYTAYDIPTAVEIGDVNGDGRQDVVALHAGWNAVSVFTQTVEGTLAPYQLFSLPPTTNSEVQALDLGDLNHDGYMDIVVSEHNSGLVVLYQNVVPDFDLFTPGYMLFGSTGGTISLEVELVSYYGYTQPVHLSITGLPEGITYSFGDNPVWPPGSVNLILSVDAAMPPGTYWVNVTGFANGVLHIRNIGLAIFRPAQTLDVEVPESLWLGQRIQFMASADGSDMLYHWDFGDGGFDANNPTWHVYPALGEYTVTVHAWNPVSRLEKSFKVTIVDWPVTGLNIGAQGPLYARLPARINAFISAGTNPHFAWDFGDGGQATGAQVNHVFQFPGQYTVRVSASNGSGVQTAEAVVEVVRPFEQWLPFAFADSGQASAP